MTLLATRPALLKATVSENILIAPNIAKLTLRCPEISENSTPGQFISILCDGLTLRRPFSISQTEEDSFSVVYALKGEGTKYMLSLRNGEIAYVIGSLGNGFDISKDKALLVGGGVGYAPLIYLSQVMKTKNIEHYILTGFKESTDIKELNKPNNFIVTEDGSSDYSGRIDNWLEYFIVTHGIKRIYACGPHAMLKYVSKTAMRYNIESQVAIEKVFACGTGVCMGCSIETIDGGTIKNKRVCKDGPVFRGENVLW